MANRYAIRHNQHYWFFMNQTPKFRTSKLLIFQDEFEFGNSVSTVAELKSCIAAYEWCSKASLWPAFDMRCSNVTDCYFFQECLADSRTALCQLGNCELSAWFISVIFWSVIASLGFILACFCCAICPIHRCLVERGKIQANNNKMAAVVSTASTRMPSTKRSIVTFEDVVLVRSLSEHNKWSSCVKPDFY